MAWPYPPSGSWTDAAPTVCWPVPVYPIPLSKQAGVQSAGNRASYCTPHNWYSSRQAQAPSLRSLWTGCWHTGAARTVQTVIRWYRLCLWISGRMPRPSTRHRFRSHDKGSRPWPAARWHPSFSRSSWHRKGNKTGCSVSNLWRRNSRCQGLWANDSCMRRAFLLSFPSLYGNWLYSKLIPSF